MNALRAVVAALLLISACGMSLSVPYRYDCDCYRLAQRRAEKGQLMGAQQGKASVELTEFGATHHCGSELHVGTAYGLSFSGPKFESFDMIAETSGGCGLKISRTAAMDEQHELLECQHQSIDFGSLLTFSTPGVCTLKWIYKTQDGKLFSGTDCTFKILRPSFHSRGLLSVSTTAQSTTTAAQMLAKTTALATSMTSATDQTTQSLATSPIMSTSEQTVATTAASETTATPPLHTTNYVDPSTTTSSGEIEFFESTTSAGAPETSPAPGETTIVLSASTTVPDTSPPSSVTTTASAPTTTQTLATSPSNDETTTPSPDGTTATTMSGTTSEATSSSAPLTTAETPATTPSPSGTTATPLSGSASSAPILQETTTPPPEIEPGTTSSTLLSASTSTLFTTLAASETSLQTSTAQTSDTFTTETIEASAPFTTFPSTGTTTKPIPSSTTTPTPSSIDPSPLSTVRVSFAITVQDGGFSLSQQTSFRNAVAIVTNVSVEYVVIDDVSPIADKRQESRNNTTATTSYRISIVITVPTESANSAETVASLITTEGVNQQMKRAGKGYLPNSEVVIVSQPVVVRETGGGVRTHQVKWWMGWMVVLLTSCFVA